MCKSRWGWNSDGQGVATVRGSPRIDDDCHRPAGHARRSTHAAGTGRLCPGDFRAYLIASHRRMWPLNCKAELARVIDGSSMNEMKQVPVNGPPSPKRSFAAMRHSGFRAQFITFVLAMMADNIEHVISYWMLYQKFHSPALAGFAIVSHWLPFLMFSVASGALADRFDPRRVIQIGMGLFIIASLSWSYFFVTDTLQMWQAMVILVIHGCAGVLWQTPNQMLLYDIVGPSDLESAVRLNAMARYLGILAGPA